jgi:hypothetical protein
MSLVKKKKILNRFKGPTGCEKQIKNCILHNVLNLQLIILQLHVICSHAASAWLDE